MIDRSIVYIENFLMKIFLKNANTVGCLEKEIFIEQTFAFTYQNSQI